EAFVVPEAKQLERVGHTVLVIPRSPRGPVLHGGDLLHRSIRKHIFSPRVVLTALAVAFKSPRTALRAIRPLLKSRSLSIFVKNLAVVPKGLWLGSLGTRLKVDHINSHWASTTATMAMIASRFSGIPWSFTAHRWDIVENNLLADKTNQATLARFISED